MVRDPWDLRPAERAALHPYTPSHPAFIDITDMDVVVELDDQPQVVDLTEEDGVNVGASGSGVGRAGSAGRGGRGHGGRDGGGGHGGSAQGGSGQGEGPGGGASAV